MGGEAGGCQVCFCKSFVSSPVGSKREGAGGQHPAALLQADRSRSRQELAGLKPPPFRCI